MFSAEISDAKILRDSIDAISQIIDEGSFKIKKDGIELLATDRAMVAAVNFRLASSAFNKYECDKETSIGLNLSNFIMVLKRASGSVEMKLNEDESKLELTIAGDSVRNFSIPLITLSSDEIPPITQLEFPAAAEIKSAVMEDGIADADIIADSVVIEIAENGFKMRAEGDSSKTDLSVERGNEALVSIDVKDSVKARYPLDYLKKFIKAAKISDTAKIQLGTDFPMKIELKGNDVYLAMVLAPRVEES